MGNRFKLLLSLSVLLIINFSIGIATSEELPRRDTNSDPTGSKTNKAGPDTLIEDLPRRSGAPDSSERSPLEDTLEAISPDFITPRSNRWRLPSQKLNFLNPYSQNILKGDFPIIGDDIFLIFTGISDSLFEFREIPVPTNISSADPGSPGFFGGDDQYFLRQNFFFRFELLQGDTAFKPPSWIFVANIAFNVPEYLNAEETGVVDIDIEEGTSRATYDVALQELFFEYHLADISKRYDFISARIGIQPFNADFRGFLSLDANLGVRLLGNFNNNHYQYNLAFFDNLEKDTRSEFNTFSRRDQQFFIANLYREDLIWRGFTNLFSIAYLRDSGDLRFDENDFLVRPTAFGDAVENELNVVYLGWASNGHIGRLNISHQLYLAFGEDRDNPFTGEKVDIFGYLAALELSVDFDWLRPKISFFYSSGDGDPTDDNARGFDVLIDKPNFAGGGFSYWQRQGFRLLSTGLNQRESLIPNLRSSKIEGQPNFVNPGLLLLNAGLDVEVTPKLRTFVNLNYLRFNETSPLELFLQQPDIDNSIGVDASLGVFYRPFLNNNVIVIAGVAAFEPLDGFKDILTESTLFQGFINLVLTY